MLEDPEYLFEPVTHCWQWECRPDLEPTGLAWELDIARRYLNEQELQYLESLSAFRYESFI